MYLNENLFEQLSKTKLYFSTNKLFNLPFEPSEEGLHFEEDYNILLRVIKGLRSDKKYKYSINLNLELRPLYIDEDILFWSGPNLAELFLCKLDNINYPAAFENQTDLTPNMTHVDIVEQDRQFLETLKNEEASESSFSKIMDFIYSKGYNCISYLIYEGNRLTDRAILVDNNAPFEYNSIELIEEDS